MLEKRLSKKQAEKDRQIVDCNLHIFFRTPPGSVDVASVTFLFVCREFCQIT